MNDAHFPNPWSCQPINRSRANRGMNLFPRSRCPESFPASQTAQTPPFAITAYVHAILSTEIAKTRATDCVRVRLLDQG